jgi:hypothetical protein
MKKQLLYLSIMLAITGCQTNQSFHIPLFEDVIEYKDDKPTNTEDQAKYNEQKEKDFMYNVMAGQLELNEGNTKRAIDRYETSLSEKKNEVAYTLLAIYYKENDYNNARRIADIISANDIKSKADGDNLLVSLLNQDYEKASKYLNTAIEQTNFKNNNNLTVSVLEEAVKLNKDISDMVFFSKANVDSLATYMSKDNFVLIKFFCMYDTSNSQGIEPDEAIKYLMENKNKENVMHNFTLFRIAYVENYHVNVYKEEMMYLTDVLNNYVFDVNTLEKLYTTDINSYDRLKTKLMIKHKDNIDFWFFLYLIESKNDSEESLAYLNASFNLIMDKEITHQLKEKVINEIVNQLLNRKVYDVSYYIKALNDYEQKKEIFVMVVFKSIKDNNYDDNILTHYKGIIPVIDEYLTVARGFSHYEKYEQAMSYIEKADEMEVSNAKVSLERNMILAKVNPKIAINETEMLLEKNNTPEGNLVLLYAKLNNKENIKNGREEVKKIYNKYNKKTLGSYYYEFGTYLYSRYNYDIGKYDRAKELIEQLQIGNNHVYLADYGKILWKLNQKTKAKRIFLKSKEVFDSVYLSNILKELNIKTLE